MKAQAIIPTAGTGQRFGSQQPKPLLLLKDKPIFIHTLEVFEHSDLIESVVLVAHKDFLTDYEKAVRKFQLKKVIKIIAGGETRAQSVLNGLQVLEKSTDHVIVHDGVRPFLTEKMIEQSLQACRDCEAAIVAVPVKPTIKKVNKESLIVEKTLNREELWEIQTPQAFQKDFLVKAFKNCKDLNVTDEASLVERAGGKVKVVWGDYKNIKITTPEDLALAEVFLSVQS